MQLQMEKWLGFLAGHHGDAIACVYGDTKTTWEALNNRTNSMANALWDLGIRKDDKVTIMFHNCTEFVEATYAAQKIGAIPVPINYRFIPREIEYQTNHSDSTAFIYEDLWSDAVISAKKNLKNINHYICFRRNGDSLPEDILDYEELMEKYPSNAPPKVKVTYDDTCVMIYTGGTTGMPKGVVLTWDNHRKLVVELQGGMPGLITRTKLPPGKLASFIENKLVNTILNNPVVQSLNSSLIKTILNFQINTLLLRRLLAPIVSRTNIKILHTGFQLFHDAYFPLLMFFPMTGVPATILFPEMVSFDPEKVLDMMSDEKPGLLANTPTAWKMVIGHLESANGDKYDKSSIKVLATGGGVNPAKLKERMLKQFPQAMIMDIFGQTEMTPGTTIRIDTIRTELKDRSVGRPLVNTRIIDEDGNELKKPGEIGEIVYSGGTVMKEYYKEKDKTADVTRNGWFHSGDLGYYDEDGEIRVVDRISECINTGGEKVFPHEVEEILEENPKVERACVIGVPHELWGKAVRAVVQLKDTKTADQEELIEWCRDKMVGFKRPKSVAFADNMPISPVGKVLRKEIVDKYGS